MIRTEICLPLEFNTDVIRRELCRLYPMDADEILELRLLRRNLVLADGERPYYKCSLAFSASPERESGLLKLRNKITLYEDKPLEIGRYTPELRPVVVGAGPAGLFSALAFAEAGARPIILERGLDVDGRQRRVELFRTLGILDPECNVQFGEGGAGAFSDGKLKVGSHDPYKDKVLAELIGAGAPPSVFYADNAHLGTDKLPAILKNIRRRIESLGGEFLFGARLVDLDIADGRVRGLTFIRQGSEEKISADTVVIAIGHSATDTIRMLRSRGLPMQARGFGIGVRAEHRREYINRLIYKENADIITDTASYHLVTHLAGGRSVYSFCMCPGGTVVGATDREGAIVTNGMSEYARMGDNSNAAILVSVTPSDFGSDDPLAGMELQRRIESLAYASTNNYRAPSCSLADLLGGGRTASSPEVTPTYQPGVEQVPLRAYLPDYITDSLAEGFADFDKWLPGFSQGGVALTGPETRTTSPVRMLRGDDRMAKGIVGLYPVGEGAGYAGGIITSATDGLRTACAVIARFNI